MRHYPVFVVGSPRSGTSILVDTLIAAGYRGYREGMFLSLITTLGDTVERQYRTFDANDPNVMISAIGKAGLKSDINALLKAATDRLHPDGPWFDKTGNPEMLMAIPTLLSLWPGCVFIFAKRRGIENVLSRLVKFPGHNFEYHCRDWSRNMALWRSLRDRIPQGAAIEVDQFDMISAPAAVARALSQFLCGSAEVESAIGRTLTTNRPQQTSAGSAARIASLTGSGWSESQQRLFAEHCGAEMAAYGYTMDTTYSTRHAAGRGNAA